MKAWIFRWGPAILMMAAIFFASSTPGSDIPTLGAWDLLVKKGGHMTGYALLSIAFFHALNNGGPLKRSQFLTAAVLACLYATSDEWHQKFTPGRSPSVQDVIIDSAGAFIGSCVFWLARSWLERSARRHTAARSLFDDDSALL